MGKRSQFERVEKDFYRTIDPRAVAALNPHLKSNTRFVEPFAGVGDLIDGLKGYGHICSFATENNFELLNDEKFFNDHRIRFCDAFSLKLSRPDVDFDCVITNPPWSRDILHKAIEHFGSQCETWFLFDAAWMFNKRHVPQLLKKYCTDIVAVGRLRWIPDTKMSGKDDCAWYRFSPDKNGETVFHNDR